MSNFRFPESWNLDDQSDQPPSSEQISYEVNPSILGKPMPRPDKWWSYMLDFWTPPKPAESPPPDPEVPDLSNTPQTDDRPLSPRGPRFEGDPLRLGSRAQPTASNPPTNSVISVADKPRWGGWGMSPWPEDNDNVPPNNSPTPICDRALANCHRFGIGTGPKVDPDSYRRFILDCGEAYRFCHPREMDQGRIGSGADRIEFPDGAAVIFRRGQPPGYIPSPRR